MFARFRAALALADALQTQKSRLDGQEARLAAVERRSTLDSTDVSEALDKMERLAGRVAKRAARDAPGGSPGELQGQGQVPESPAMRELRIRRGTPPARSNGIT